MSPEVHVHDAVFDVGDHPARVVDLRYARGEAQAAGEPAHAAVSQVKDQRPTPLAILPDERIELEAPPVVDELAEGVVVVGRREHPVTPQPPHGRVRRVVPRSRDPELDQLQKLVVEHGHGPIVSNEVLDSMSPPQQPDPRFPTGADFAWLASDAAGHVAVFTNAGEGPIPRAVLELGDRADSGASSCPSQEATELRPS